MRRSSSITRLVAGLGLLAALACTTVGGAGAAPTSGFALAIGGVRDACTSMHLGGATVTFTPVGTSDIAPGALGQAVTNPGGQFQAALAPGDYRVAVTLDGYSEVSNIDGDPVGTFTVRTGLVNHVSLALHPPSPC